MFVKTKRHRNKGSSKRRAPSSCECLCGARRKFYIVRRSMGQALQAVPVPVRMFSRFFRFAEFATRANRELRAPSDVRG